MHPGAGPDQASFAAAEGHSPFGATHVAISVDRSEADITAAAEREGWRAVRCDRGSFTVVEVWLENATMIEFLTPEMAADYLAAVRAG